MSTSLRFWVTALAVGLVRVSYGQPATPRFDVASIRMTDPAARQNSHWDVSPSGDINIHDVPLYALIMAAYGIEDYQLTGYPAWATNSYDVVARATREDGAGSNSKTQDMLRLRSLLEERCQLAVKRGTKKMTTWVLAVDRAGPRMEAMPEARQESSYSPIFVHANTMTMQVFARILSNFLGGPVEDQTGLTGDYKFDAKWSLPPRFGNAMPVASQPDAPELPSAMRQLGLNLTAKPRDVETIEVIHLDKPGPN